ncbi:MAG TPA: patatin-like phospholipase family protein [Stellaceae bacterium]|nr:patatin-like phospholipase family protein [Stellaceae bacterium]
MTRHFDFQFGSGGIIAGRRITEALAKGYGDLTIEALRLSFACVATDLDSGHEVWLRSGSLGEAVRASYAIPGIFPPVPRHDRWLVDGGLVNPLPVSLCRALGADMTIAVDLRTDRFGPEPGEEEGLDPARQARGSDANSRAFIRSYLKRRNGGPSAFGVFARSLSIIQDRIADARLKADPPDAIIRPSLRTVAAAEFYRAAECIEAGEAAALGALPEIRKALARRGAREAAALERRAAAG